MIPLRGGVVVRWGLVSCHGNLRQKVWLVLTLSQELKGPVEVTKGLEGSARYKILSERTAEVQHLAMFEVFKQWYIF